MTLRTIIAEKRITVKSLTAAKREYSVAQLVEEGLSARVKSLPPMLLYDERGSKIFEEICDLPEYYLTRTEAAILNQYAEQMVAHCSESVNLIELGSGSSSKTRILLDALLKQGTCTTYRPIDISESMLSSTAHKLLAEYPELMIRAIAGDYSSGLTEVKSDRTGQKMFIFLGSNLGNFSRAKAVDFLRSIRAAMSAGDVLFLGVDMVKSQAMLEAAYNDAQGVTARFTGNLLVRLNSELGADFDSSLFTHHVVWNERTEAMDIFLRSEVDQTITVAALNMLVPFEGGELLHTESSHKYTEESLADLSVVAGLAVAQSWYDDNRWFSVNLVVPIEDLAKSI
ncbi:L-histidine N(alpha)-methyltransferase [Candidatus Neomarinimicrobiota bacterium]